MASRAGATRDVADRRAIGHQLRSAIEADGRTAYALGKAAGVDAGVIQRFLNRERGLTLDTVDRLGLALGLRLVEAARGRGRPARPTRPGRPDPIAGDFAGADGGGPDHPGPSGSTGPGGSGASGPSGSAEHAGAIGAGTDEHAEEAGR